MIISTVSRSSTIALSIMILVSGCQIERFSRSMPILLPWFGVYPCDITSTGVSKATEKNCGPGGTWHTGGGYH
jgi:hypothetical protein